MALLDQSEARNDLFRVYEKREERGRYCGRNLVAALQLVCKGVYNTMFNNNKKSVRDESSIEYRDDRENGGDLDYPFESRAKAIAFLPTNYRKRMRRGVYDECCQNSCTVSICKPERCAPYGGQVVTESNASPTTKILSRASAHLELRAHAIPDGQYK
uniref:Insulin-like peptide 1 n=1 Tax=Nilaparvata lugens TaxID=108931 RepID=A0A0C4UQP8_NILLU